MHEISASQRYHCFSEEIIWTYTAIVFWMFFQMCVLSEHTLFFFLYLFFFFFFHCFPVNKPVNKQSGASHSHLHIAFALTLHYVSVLSFYFRMCCNWSWDFWIILYKISFPKILNKTIYIYNTNTLNPFSCWCLLHISYNMPFYLYSVSICI